MKYARLLKLASYLDTVPKENFNFTVYLDRNSCGTVGCAIGHCPTVFPSMVRVNDYSEVIFPDGRAFSEGAHSFFGIDSEIIEEIFHPESYYYSLPIIQLPNNATASQVARNIRNVVEREAKLAFKEACRKMTTERLQKWERKLAKSKRVETSYGFLSPVTNSYCYCVIGAYASSCHKWKEWLTHDGTASAWDQMPEFDWHEIDGDESHKECCATILNDDFHFSFAKFRKLINEVLAERVSS